MASDSLSVVVVGGGAAGFFGAIACASQHPNSRVTLLEAARQPLAKVRVSGGGRCNVTHACFDPALLVQHYPRGGKALRSPFSRFQARDTVEWFELHGVTLKTESDGRMFPLTDDSATIVDCLMQTAKMTGVKIWQGAAVKAVTRKEDGFRVDMKAGEVLSCDRLLLATGSSPQGYAIAQALGHTIAPPVPSLFTFNLKDSRLQDLAGVSVQNAHLRLQIEDKMRLQIEDKMRLQIEDKMRLQIEDKMRLQIEEKTKLQTGEKSHLEQTGALLITHWGLSGPAVLKLSAWGARALHDSQYQATLLVNWLPQSNPETLRQQLLAVKTQLPKRAIATSCPVLIPRRLWERLTNHVGITAETRWAELSNKTLNLLLQELTRGQYTISGKGAFKEEFVTCGGVSLKEVDFKTMESRLCPGLHFAGELLDIDGVTGGFNFQSAWTTGWIAGQAMGAA